MTKPQDTNGGGTARRIAVWDLPTRLFHWLLVLCVAIGAVTGFLAPEWMLGLHVWSGYGLGVLILFRLVWAFWGSEYSRVSSFLFSPRTTFGHLRNMIAGRGGHFLGHNPAGAAMIFALAAVLAGILVTGLLALGGQEKLGPLAGLLSYRAGHGAKEVHEVLTILLLVLVALHLAGVAMESLRGPDNLVRAMIHGRKTLPPGQAAPAMRPARPIAAAVTLAVAAIVLAAGIGRLAAIPPLGIPALGANPLYEKECGACHYDFHPSLLPAKSWAAMMAGLDDHFGEDASLPDAIRDEIAAWLAANAAERWDSEAGNAFRRTAADQPLRITETRFWKRRHHDIPDAVFASKPVGGKVNCVACHRDARSGRFADQSIDIPKEKS